MDPIGEVAHSSVLHKADQPVTRRLTILLCCAAALFAQVPTSFQYFYDDNGQLIKAVDSAGIVIEYVYDEVGNMLQIKREAPVF